MSKSNIIRELLDQKRKLQDAITNRDAKVPDMLEEHNDLYREYAKLMKMPVDDNIRKARQDITEKMVAIERKMPKLRISDFKINPNSNATDEEMIRYAKNFLELDPSEMEKLHIGSGVFKDSYEIPGTGLVLKKSGGIVGSDGEIINDYLSNKIMEDSFPSGLKTGSAEALNPEWSKQFLERPKLIITPEKEPLLIQKKLVNIPHLLHYKLDVDPRDMESAYRKNIDDTFLHSFKPTDLHGGNLGIDPVSGKMKAFDAMSSNYALEKLSDALPKFKNLIYKLKSPTVYRSIAPVVAKGALATAGGLVSLGEAMADTSTGNEGEVAEVKAMREQEKQRKFRETHPEMKDVFEKADTHLSEFGPKDYDLKPMQEKPEFKKLRGIFK